MRLDVFLTDNGYTRSRSRAKELIESGNVVLDGVVIKKPSWEVPTGEGISHKVELMSFEKYVSRGGLKLEGAIENFKIDVSGSVCVDIGASTGGFTDCLLQHGARFVYAFDSGKDQLVKEIASNPCVLSREKFNARNLKPEDISQHMCADVAVMDVSFISQTYIIPNVYSVLKDGGIFISLIKPQFEAGAAALDKGGIVRLVSDRKRAVEKVVLCATECGFELMGLMRSPIEGGDGNIEYLAYFVRSKQCVDGGQTQENINTSVSEFFKMTKNV